MKKLLVLAVVVLAAVALAWGFLQGMPKTRAANDEAEIRQVYDRWGESFPRPRC